MMPERQERSRNFKNRLGKTAFIFGNLSLATMAVISSCVDSEEEQNREPIQTTTPTVRAIEPTLPSQTPLVTEMPISTPTTEPTPEIEEQSTGVFTTDNLNVRSGPGLNFSALETMPRNTLGDLLEGPVESDGYVWWHVRYEDGTEGWSAQDWLKIGKWPATEECNFSKPVVLRESASYGIFGDDTFDTLVCGYLKSGEIITEDEEKVTVPYLAIVDYKDEGFIKAIDDGIAIGNGVNRKGPRYYELNLGCLKEGKIVGIEHEEGKSYLDQETERAILESSPEKLASIVLSFGPHPGKGCVCCNLAHTIRLY